MVIISNFLVAVATVLKYVLNIFMWIVIARAILSWVNPDPYNTIVKFIQIINFYSVLFFHEIQSKFLLFVIKPSVDDIVIGVMQFFSVDVCLINFDDMSPACCHNEEIPCPVAPDPVVQDDS